MLLIFNPLGTHPVSSMNPTTDSATERQLTDGSENVLLTNAAVWSHDGQWIYYDVRSDPSGSVFDGNRIERVHVRTGRKEVVYKSTHDSHVGVVTANPTRDQVVFIHGPENPTEDWQYTAYHRRGVLVSPGNAGTNLDARDLTAPFTPGALRGGSHVHVFSGDGQWVSFTYEDHVLATAANSGDGIQTNQRNVGVSVPAGPVRVPKTHQRNHEGDFFSVLVTQTTDHPTPGSDEISRAYSDAWVGSNGYLRDGAPRQTRALAFLGNTLDERGNTVPELFLVDIPDDVTQTGERPLGGTAITRPAPPRGTVQRRLTRTHHRRHPGLGDVRHWPRSSPDGARIAFLMKDDAGLNQLWLIDPMGESLSQLTRGDSPVESAFTFRPDGQAIACVIGGQVAEVNTTTGEVTALTAPPGTSPHSSPDAQAVVYSPDGRTIAFQRGVTQENKCPNAIFLVLSTLGTMSR